MKDENCPRIAPSRAGYLCTAELRNALQAAAGSLGDLGHGAMTCARYSPEPDDVEVLLVAQQEIDMHTPNNQKVNTDTSNVEREFLSDELLDVVVGGRNALVNAFVRGFLLKAPDEGCAMFRRSLVGC